MPDDGRPIDDDVLALLGLFRSRTEAGPAREPVARRAERRRGDRRGLGFKARRRDDAELNRKLRIFLFDYFRSLSHDTLLTWVDGLWLGRAIDAELAFLVDCATDSGLPAPASKRKRGRPPADQFTPLVPAIPNPAVRSEWKELTAALTELSATRRRYHAHANRKRRGTRRSQEHRSACLATAIGQRVERAGLFGQFFDEVTLTPQQMAARLLHRDHEQRLTAYEAHAREKAATARSAERRAYWQAEVTKASALRRQLGSWKTLLNQLQRRRRALPL